MVYVDKFQTPYRRMKMSHMLADTLEELHAAAAKVGLKRSWFQTSPIPHYDLCQSKKKQALENGATEIGRRKTAEIIKDWKSRA